MSSFARDTCVEEIDYRTARGLDKSVIRLGRDAREPFRPGPDRCGQELRGVYTRAQSLFRDLAIAERRDFWEICEDRYQVRSTILTSQLLLARWHEQIGDPTLAGGILDRLVNNAHRFEMRGESMRKNRQSQMCNFRFVRNRGAIGRAHNYDIATNRQNGIVNATALGKFSSA